MQELCAVRTEPQHSHILFTSLVLDKRPEETATQYAIATTAEEGDSNTEVNNILAGGRDDQQKTDAVTCTALGGGLGTLAAVLILILVGVVLMWVWSCYRNKIK